MRPENRLAVEAGLEVGPRGGIRVNEHLQTSDPDIYAVGDAIEVTDFVTGEPTQVPLAGPANRQGRIAADHIFGRPARYRGTQGTAIVRVFDRTAAMTGASEKALRRPSRPYRKVYVHPAHHAGYYPGAEAMTLKLLFDPETGQVLGAQAVGGAGVDKRIDVLAVAIQAGHDRLRPGGDGAGLRAAVRLGQGPGQHGRLRGRRACCGATTRRSTSRRSWPRRTSERPFLLDVRTPQEFAAGHIPGAVEHPGGRAALPAGRAAPRPRDRRLLPGRAAGLPGDPHPAPGRVRAANIGGGYKTFRLFRPD